MSASDFYIVLPSNSCPSVHPNNNASKFYVTLPETIHLDENWKVALTEIDYNYAFLTVDKEHGISYICNDPIEVQVDFELTYSPSKGIECDFPPFKFAPEPRWPPYDEFTPLQLQWEVLPQKENPKPLLKIELVNNTHEFKLKFDDLYTAQQFGFDYLDVESVFENGIFILRANKPIKETKENISLRATCTFRTVEFDRETVITFPKADRLATRADFLTLLSDCFKDKVFSKIQLYGDLLYIVPLPHINKIKFLKGLNLILGFAETEIQVTKGGAYKAIHPLQLERGIKNLLVYASVAQPIYVGDTRAPLLKHISLPRKTDGGGYTHFSMLNPMYVPVSQLSINTIEINMRSDSGELMPFIPGSITTIVLHFKKQ